jgi:hydroxymethylpyrimidine pyrophosphatase-like HAD family hydrolase
LTCIINIEHYKILIYKLKNEPSISKQPFNPPYRHAYYYQSEIIKDRLLPKIESLGFECIASSGVYLDILPKNFDKGRSLLYLLDQLQIDHDSVVTAGDSLNELPLFKTNLSGIAVGNAEANLLPHIANMDNIYVSPYHGVSGIIDGLINYQWIAAVNCQQPLIF